MANDHWQDVEELYAAVVDLTVDERRRLLDEHRAQRPRIVSEVESLLTANPPPPDFLDSLWASGMGTPGARRSLHGRTIGAFRLLDTIGSGGMGEVYRAERADAGFDQRVAIKVVTAARWHRASLRQFKAERQVLATLHHPHIVTLIDGGLTDDGLAYLVMEYVDGVPITTYCTDRHLDVRARLALFQQVCRAVQYAHRRSIVHRDLKPANILVTPDGVPKILDFGIARLLTDQTATTSQTTLGLARALTPDYASPDQARGLPPSTADDVYALGVLLFELLAGRTPYETAGKPLDELLRLVIEQPIPRPSQAVGRGRVHLGSDVSGDLDAIVLKAVDKDATRRYGSAQELADDIGRHLAGQVVVAREPSFTYVLATLARRHRALVAASLVSAMAVLAALGVSIVQTRRALAERDRADRRFGEVRRLANTLIFDIHDAVQPLPGSTPVRQKIVAEALTYLEGLAHDTEDAALRLELGVAYQRIGTVQGNPTASNLGDREGAVASYEKAIGLLTPVAAQSRDAALELTRTRFSLVSTLSALGRREQALETAREAQSTVEHLVEEDATDAEARRLLGTAFFWQATMSPTGTEPGQSIPLWLNARQVFESILAEAPDRPDWQRNVALVAKYLGEQYRQVGDVDSALRELQRAQEIDQRRVTHSPDNRQAQLDLALDWSSLGGVYLGQERLADAAESFEQSLAVRQKLAASDPDDDYLRGRLAHAYAMLGRVYTELGRLPEAFDHLQHAVRLNESRRALDLEGRIDLARQLVELSKAERKAGRLERACAALEQARGIDFADATPAESFQGTRQGVQAAIVKALAQCTARVSPGAGG